MQTVQDYAYSYSASAIAQHPTHPRDHSKLLQVHRSTQTFSHHHFFDLPSLLKPTDILVMNNSKTLPCRVLANKSTGGKIEVLFLRSVQLPSADSTTEHWEVLTKPGLAVGQRVTTAQGLEIECIQNLGYTRVVERKSNQPITEYLLEHGSLPLPPYIHERLQDNEEYQTVYAKTLGSAATPTAGLHFTPEVLHQLRARGVSIFELTLHVGLGTFLPVKVTNIKDHVMHAERFELTVETAQAINSYKHAGSRCIAVGTTSFRVLETCSSSSGILTAQSGEADLFVHPPYSAKCVDGLITNFHIPESTLLMLVTAFCGATGQESGFAQTLAGKAYAEALAHHYRLFSLGDAMLIT